MRIMTAAIVASTILTIGCSKSDAEVRSEFKDKLRSECSREMGIGGPPRMDVNRFCDCFVDAAMKDRSTEELKRIDADPKAAEEAGKNIGQACLYTAMPVGS